MDEERLQALEAGVAGLASMTEYLLIEVARLGGDDVLTTRLHQLRLMQSDLLIRQPPAAEVEIRAVDLQIDLTIRALHAEGHRPSVG